MELLALCVLAPVSGYLAISDWKTRTVTLQEVIACYCIAGCLNAAVLIAGVVAMLEGDLYGQATGASGWRENSGELGVAIAIIIGRADSILAVLFLSCTIFAFNLLGLLASGDALAIPAMLAMLALVAQPDAIVIYFVSAMVFVLVISAVRNLYNNLQRRGPLQGPLWQRLYLMLFCYYGSGGECRYGFQYSGKTRRDYDNEPYYSGKEKTWLVPGLPLLFGFAPAILVLLLFID